MTECLSNCSIKNYTSAKKTYFKQKKKFYVRMFFYWKDKNLFDK